MQFSINETVSPSVSRPVPLPLHLIMPRGEPRRKSIKTEGEEDRVFILSGEAEQLLLEFECVYWASWCPPMKTATSRRMGPTNECL